MGQFSLVLVIKTKMANGAAGTMHPHPPPLYFWVIKGCLFVYSLKAASDASSLGLNTHVVRDAGRTQISPGSKTVLCIGPGSYMISCTEIVYGTLKQVKQLHFFLLSPFPCSKGSSEHMDIATGDLKLYWLFKKCEDIHRMFTRIL